jgi:hypothetical protein
MQRFLYRIGSEDVVPRHGEYLPIQTRSRPTHKPRLPAVMPKTSMTPWRRSPEPSRCGGGPPRRNQPGCCGG